MNGIYVKVIALIIRDLRSQLEARDKTISAVRAIHRQVIICPEAEDEWNDPCPCGDPTSHYLICQACCTHNLDQTEDCATYHDHGPNKPMCLTTSVLDGTT